MIEDENESRPKGQVVIPQNIRKVLKFPRLKSYLQTRR